MGAHSACCRSASIYHKVANRDCLDLPSFTECGVDVDECVFLPSFNV